MIAADQISYKEVSVNDMTLVRHDRNPVRPDLGKKVTGVIIGDEQYDSTERFMTSMCSVFGFSPSIFNYFSPDEVLTRVMEKRRNSAKVRVTIETTEKKRVLGVSKPQKPIVDINMLETILAPSGISLDLVGYHDGLVTSWHHPRMQTNFRVKSDDFAGRFVLETPIDGYGTPSVFLSLIRQVCSNGAIAHSKVFRSQAALGKTSLDAAATMGRFIESFNNEEGYAALQQRLESAVKSPASLDEYFSFYRLLSNPVMNNLHVNSEGEPTAPFASILTGKLKAICGSIESYGLVSFDALSPKKRRIIPTTSSVYDLINFATELATHLANVEQERKIQGWVGSLLSAEYDLEGTLADNEQPADLLIIN